MLIKTSTSCKLVQAGLSSLSITGEIIFAVLYLILVLGPYTLSVKLF